MGKEICMGKEIQTTVFVSGSQILWSNRRVVTLSREMLMCKQLFTLPTWTDCFLATSFTLRQKDQNDFSGLAAVGCIGKGQH